MSPSQGEGRRFESGLPLIMKKTVVIGVSSGIAAYKEIDLIKLLKKDDLEVFVVMSQNAVKMISPDEFESASGNKVFIELFKKGFNFKTVLEKRKVDHIDLADKADLIVIVPATANTIAKIAHGIADDFLTTTLLAVTSPVIVCPSMNVNMWQNPLVQQNVSKLKNIGYQIIEPVKGMLACGYEGKGRLEDINLIKEEIMRQLNRAKSLSGKKVIVTAGGTLEKIDSVRYITNKSSGKMGIAIAEECYLRGADVLLLRAKSSVTPRYLITEEVFETAEELSNIIENQISNCNMFFHVAAVSDFQIAGAIDGKISSKKGIALQLKPRQKILDNLKKLNPKMDLIAFKAEYGLGKSEMIRVAYKRLQEAKADAIVANDISRSDRGFQADTNEAYVVLKNGEYHKIPLSSKREVASELVDFVSKKFYS
jgi:phosphopantothenoylcysteine decarboxylase/phosphopantothenate--cysteine ligase